MKVQRAGIGKAIAVDLLVMGGLARLIDLFGLCRPGSARMLLQAFTPALSSEIDYRAPVRFIRLRQKCAEGDSNEVNVTVVTELSARRVLTTKLIDGILVVDILRALQSDDRPFLESLAVDGHGAEEIGRRIYWNMLNQVYRDGIFHADLTPASLMVLPRNAIAYIDFGMMGRFSDELKDACHFLFASLCAHQIDRAIDEFERWTVPSSATDATRFRSAMTRVFEEYLDSFRSPVGSVPRQAAANFVINLMICTRHHRVVIVDDMALYLRAVLTTEAIVLELAPGLELTAEAGRFLAKAMLLDVRGALSPLAAYQNMLEWASAANQMLSDVGNIQRSGSSLEISLRTLKVRLFEYGLWTVLVGGLAYLVYTGEQFQAFGVALGIGSEWIAGALVAGAAVMLLMMWRQGRKLMAIDRSTLTRSHVLTRSRGRVR